MATHRASKPATSSRRQQRYEEEGRFSQKPREARGRRRASSASQFLEEIKQEPTVVRGRRARKESVIEDTSNNIQNSPPEDPTEVISNNPAITEETADHNSSGTENVSEEDSPTEVINTPREEEASDLVEEDDSQEEDFELPDEEEVDFAEEKQEDSDSDSKPTPSVNTTKNTHRKNDNETPSDKVSKSPKKKEKKSKKKGWLFASIGLIFALLIGALVWFIVASNQPEEADLVTIPRAKSEIQLTDDKSKTCENFTAKGIICNVTIDFSDEVDKGLLISQSIKPGEKVEKETASIILSYSKGPESSKMPNVSRMTVGEAKSVLEPIGVEIGKVTEVDSPDVEAGRIVKSSVNEGDIVKNGDKIDVEIASGSVKVPDWKGKTKDEVLIDAGNIGLSVKFTEKESDATPGTVISQTPNAGEQARGEVAVVLAKGKEAKQVEIPNVVNMTRENAQTELASAGFTKISLAQVENTAVKEPKVTQVVPGVGTKVSTEEQIVVIVSVPPSKPAPTSDGGR